MKRLLILAALAIASLHATTPTAAEAPAGLLVVNSIVSTNVVVATVNTTADYTDGIMFTVFFSDGRVESRLVHRTRLQREPSVAMFHFDPTRTKPIGVVAATLSSVYTARADIR